MFDYSELKQLAEAATNGRWHEDDLGDALEFAPLDGEDQAFILAASPAVVFELIAENELLRTTKSALVSERQAHIRQRDQLKAENEALRKDAERYRLFAETVAAEFSGVALTGSQKALFDAMNSREEISGADEVGAMFDAAMEVGQ